MSKADWVAIKLEYINGDTSIYKLADKYHLSRGMVAKHCREEHWVEEKKKQQQKIYKKVARKTAEKIANKEANRIVQLQNISDKLLKQIDKATDQLDQVLVTERTTKTVRSQGYENGRPVTREQRDEKEKREMQTVIVDRQGLVQVANALKSVKDILLFTQDGVIEEDSDAFFAERGLFDGE